MTTLTRREFTVLAGAAAAAGLAAPRALAGRLLVDRAVFEWKDAGRVQVVFGQGGNAMVLCTRDGALLVDCKNAGYGDALRREAGMRCGVSTVVNTHHHADHTGGNYAFTEDLTVIAHQNAAPRIAAQTDRYLNGIRAVAQRAAESNDPADRRVAEDAAGLAESLTAEDFAPTRTLSAFESLKMGGFTIELRHRGPGHTDNDIFVYLPEQNIVHTGDLLFHRLHPFIDRGAGATTIGWIESCKSMLSVCDQNTIVIPGHGEVTDASGIRGQIEYFEQTREAVQKAIDAGMSREEIVEATFPHFEGLGFDQIRPRSLGAIYDELKEG